MIKFISLTLLSFSALAFDWQGHRGARGLYPENTIAGMLVSLKYPITTLELDVVVSKDMKVVVSHEPWMSEEICHDPKGNLVKDKEVNLFKLNFDEILKYDCGSKIHPRFPEQVRAPEHKPLLIDLIEAAEIEMERIGKKKTYSIEIKSLEEDEKAGFQPYYKIFTDEVMKTLGSKLHTSRYIIQSFDWRVLRYMHTKYPEVRLVALRETPYTAEGVIQELGFHPTVFSPDWSMLSEKDIKFFHNLGTIVVPWTVNKVDVMKKLIRMGVDGIITDYPNLILEVCGLKESFFEGKCVKVPKHAVPWDQNPGWVCEHGYHQKRSECIKIKLPKNAIFTEDGKTWICKEGFNRYRASCKKK